MSTVALPRRYKPRFYVGIAAFMSLMVLIGFWPTYFGQFVSGIPDCPWIVHLHGWIFVGWMVLLVTQVVLAAKGKIAAHRSLGAFGMAYGFLILAMGIVVSIVPGTARFQAGGRRWTKLPASSSLPSATWCCLQDSSYPLCFTGIGRRYTND